MNKENIDKYSVLFHRFSLYVCSLIKVNFLSHRLKLKKLHFLVSYCTPNPKTKQANFAYLEAFVKVSKTPFVLSGNLSLFMCDVKIQFASDYFPLFIEINLSSSHFQQFFLYPDFELILKE